MYDHYISVVGGIITDRYAGWQTDKRHEAEVLFAESEEMHAHLVWGDRLINDRGQYRFKWDGEVVERTQQELDDEWAGLPPQPPTSEERLASAEAAVLAIMEVLASV
jgi:hypothetical protein